MDDKKPIGIASNAVPTVPAKSNYPTEFAKRVEGRSRRRLGDFFDLKNFGVNLTTLAPGAQSALLHRHAKQDEFVYIVEGEAVLRTDEGEMVLTAGMCAGFPAAGIAHHLVNRSNAPVTYLEIGDRTPGDSGSYPEDDLVATQDANGAWVFSRKDGTKY